MIKKTILFISLLMVINVYVNAQIHKRFVDGNYRFIKDKDSTKAYGYVLFQKFEQDSSVVWSVVRFDKFNNITFKGFYLDEDLTVLHGKVTYYQVVVEQKSLNDHQVSLDTVLKVKTTGFYINGIKSGIWTDYFGNNVKHYSVNYDDDVRNGFFEEYDQSGIIYSSGNYLDGRKEGDWYVYNRDSTISTHSVFWHDRIIKYKEFNKNEKVHYAYPGYNFNYQISRYLKKLGIPAVTGGAIVSFTITKDGKLINPKLIAGVSPDFDKALIDALNNCSRWIPALYQKKHVEEPHTLVFEYKAS